MPRTLPWVRRVCRRRAKFPSWMERGASATGFSAAPQAAAADGREIKDRELKGSGDRAGSSTTGASPGSNAEGGGGKSVDGVEAGRQARTGEAGVDKGDAVTCTAIPIDFEFQARAEGKDTRDGWRMLLGDAVNPHAGVGVQAHARRGAACWSHGRSREALACCCAHAMI